ncbi:tetratricopeptide repeat protein [Pseudoduganella lutea]|uniref:Tetratricopeptide repeat protein n=1 Tax=Pseudoduganella lutea TaxID=321985 RepID=A0A4P6L2M2_9BURK|nr:tetratricopeptide repeat protein [Pseudoduganella lutea]QBE65800.1 tetratricopeptide repeat protein [Pseudoduganella lutea]
MQKLEIRHDPEGDGFHFRVQRILPDSIREAAAVAVADPLALALSQTNSRLGDELTWYLEYYLDYPYGPNQQRAERVTTALKEWGIQAFNALFGQDKARDWYRDATRSAHAELHLIITSDDARVLAWPWEALHDPLVGDLALHCRIERQLQYLEDPPEPHPALSRESIGILLVTARPYDADVGYRSISRPLVELIHKENLPARVKLLRPPTFDQLRAELQANPGAYHIVHFDGHGGFGIESDKTGQKLKGAQGQLIFEQHDGSEAFVTGELLSQLLREHRIPIAVLNACQSATLDAEAEDAFASVATSLLKAGVRSVVAMGYSLYVSAAREFLPPFYRRLFESGSVADATRAGRQALVAHPERRSGFALQDWLVPVLYQQQPLHFKFTKQTHVETHASEFVIPEAARLDTSETPYGLIGRDSAVLALERASRRPPAALLVHGMGGVGKTTLVRGYIDWLARTEGLPPKIVWISFVDTGFADYVLSRLVEATLGIEAIAEPGAQKWSQLVRFLRNAPLLIVWDDFKCTNNTADVGTDETSGCLISADDRQRLKHFLQQLRGGKSKVLITSRTDEDWLDTSECWRIPLSGLQGEEREELAQHILSDHGIRLNPKDHKTTDLITSMEGHPLMMRVILPKLARESPATLMQAMAQYLAEPASFNSIERQLYATLCYVQGGLPTKLKPLLYPVGLHGGNVDTAELANMASRAAQPFTAQQTQNAMEMLEAAGLAQEIGCNIFKLHPALVCYLRGEAKSVVDSAAAQAWRHAFVATMATLVGLNVSSPLHSQHTFYSFFGKSVEQACKMVDDFVSPKDYGTLMQYLGNYAYERQDMSQARTYFETLAQHSEMHGNDTHASVAYHMLGMVAARGMQVNVAEEWYRKSLKIKERLCDKRGVAGAHHQLGLLAQERRDLNMAEGEYRRALGIKEELGDESGIAATCHQLGTLAHSRGDFHLAEICYNKALGITERLGEERAAATTLHQLGVLAAHYHKFDVAEVWYRKSMNIRERIRDELGLANTHHQLGILASKQNRFDVAESEYRKALEIKERLGNDFSTATTYHQLGEVAQARRDFDIAEGWYLKSFKIRAELRNSLGAAETCHQLGMIAEERRALDVAEGWYRKSLDFLNKEDKTNAAHTYYRLGILAMEQRNFDMANNWCLKFLGIAERRGDLLGIAIIYEQLWAISMELCDLEAADRYYHKSLDSLSAYNLTQLEDERRRIHTRDS